MIITYIYIIHELLLINRSQVMRMQRDANEGDREAEERQYGVTSEGR